MKFKIILSFLTIILAMNVSYASFPVVKAETSSTEISTKNNIDDSGTYYSPAASAAEKSQGLALVFFLLLGLLAGHRWYLGSPWPWNVFFILTLGGFGIWALVDLIGIIAGTYTPARGRYKRSFF